MDIGIRYKVLHELEKEFYSIFIEKIFVTFKIWIQEIQTGNTAVWKENWIKKKAIGPLL